jgi:hypothetical protein
VKVETLKLRFPLVCEVWQIQEPCLKGDYERYRREMNLRHERKLRLKGALKTQDLSQLQNAWPGPNLDPNILEFSWSGIYV